MGRTLSCMGRVLIALVVALVQACAADLETADEPLQGIWTFAYLQPGCEGAPLPTAVWADEGVAYLTRDPYHLDPGYAVAVTWVARGENAWLSGADLGGGWRMAESTWAGFEGDDYGGRVELSGPAGSCSVAAHLEFASN